MPHIHQRSSTLVQHPASALRSTLLAWPSALRRVRPPAAAFERSTYVQAVRNGSESSSSHQHEERDKGAYDHPAEWYSPIDGPGTLLNMISEVSMAFDDPALQQACSRARQSAMDAAINQPITLKSTGTRVHILGVAHHQIGNVHDVLKVAQAVQPDLIALECPAKKARLYTSSAKRLAPLLEQLAAVEPATPDSVARTILPSMDCPSHSMASELNRLYNRYFDMRSSAPSQRVQSAWATGCPQFTEHLGAAHAANKLGVPLRGVDYTAIRRAVLDDNNMHSALVMLNAAVTKAAQGNMDAAATLLKRCIATRIPAATATASSSKKDQGLSGSTANNINQSTPAEQVYTQVKQIILKQVLPAVFPMMHRAGCAHVAAKLDQSIAAAIAGVSKPATLNVSNTTRPVINLLHICDILRQAQTALGWYSLSDEDAHNTTNASAAGLYSRPYYPQVLELPADTVLSYRRDRLEEMLCLAYSSWLQASASMKDVLVFHARDAYMCQRITTLAQGRQQHQGSSGAPLHSMLVVVGRAHVRGMRELLQNMST